MARRGLYLEPGQVEPRPGGRDEVGFGKHVLRVLPMQDLEHGVRSGDEEQVDWFLGLPAQLLKCFDRVGGPATFDLDPGDRESRVARRGDHGHQVAVLSGRHLSVGLHPRLARRDEHDLVEAELPQGHLCGDEVAMMDGVERAAHDPEALGAAHWPDCTVGLGPGSGFHAGTRSSRPG